MFSAILILGAVVASANAGILAGYGYPGYYAGVPLAAPGFFRTQYHTQANYAPVTYAAAPAAYYAAAPAVATVAAAAPVAVKTYATAYPAYANQYHSQNHLGEAAYGYSFPGQAHSAVRDAFGGVSGSYSYVGADGKPVQVNYRADAANGFQVSSNALPVAPKADLVQPENNLVAPEPVDFTPEVKAAREEHLKAVEAAKALPGYKADEPAAETSSRKKRSIATFYAGAPAVVAAAPAFYGAHGYSYATAHPAYYPSFYSAAAVPAYGYGYAAPAAIVKTEIKPLKAVEGTPASTYKFELA